MHFELGPATSIRNPNDRIASAQTQPRLANRLWAASDPNATPSKRLECCPIRVVMMNWMMLQWAPINDMWGDHQPIHQKHQKHQNPDCECSSAAFCVWKVAKINPTNPPMLHESISDIFANQISNRHFTHL